MTEKTVSWVSDISDPDQRGNRYVNVAFTDGDTGFIGKKDYDAALEVQGLLTEAKDKPADFTLEDTGKKNGRGGYRFKIKAFGEYQPTPYVQGGGVGTLTAESKYGRSPEQFIYELEYEQERMDRRTALMQAATFYSEFDKAEHVLREANAFYEWLRQTVRVEANTEQGPSTVIKHGADVQPVEVVRAGSAGSGQVADGEAGACPPHSPSISSTPNKLGRVPCVRCGVFVKREA